MRPLFYMSGADPQSLAVIGGCPRAQRGPCMQCLQGQRRAFCHDISAGAEAFPIPAIIDDPVGLRRSGIAPPPIFPDGFVYTTSASTLKATPAAHRFLDRVYPPSRSAAMWAGCQHTSGARAHPPHFSDFTSCAGGGSAAVAASHLGRASRRRAHAREMAGRSYCARW